MTIEEQVGRLSVEEKVAMLAGVDQWTTPAVGDDPIGPIKMSDGPNGARGADFAGGARSMCFPCGTALGATWDPDLVGAVGEALGAEARSKGAHVLLAPTVNLHRHPLSGRNFECFSEDPVLSAALASAYVAGVQSTGVASCVKHFVANDSEFERFTISSDVDERVLREAYLVPFEAALLEAGGWAVMSAYNKLNGTWCSENRWLLTTLLRHEWGWDGAVVSDWHGTHTTAEALLAGLDIEMPGPPAHRGEALLDAVKSGAVDEDALTAAAIRVGRLADRTGATGAGALAEERFEDDPSRVEIARRAAAEAMVLLRNEPVGGVPFLPLDAGGLGRLAVIGPNADSLHFQGGGSAQVRPARVVSPLDGLVAALGAERVVAEPGCAPASPAARLDPARMTQPGGDPGLLLRYHPNRQLSGESTFERSLRRANPVWLAGRVAGSDLEPGGWSVRASTRYRPAVSGVHVLEIRAPGSVQVTVDGHHRPERLAAGGDEVHRVALDLEDDRPFDLEVALTPPDPAPGLGFLDIRLEEPPDPRRLERAIGAATAADAALVVVGIDADIETEGRDRTSFSLPEPQLELIAAVGRVNPRTIVVVNTGSPVDMGWADDVPAVVQLWCPGQEGGHALADVLLGRCEAAGRLPTTFPRRLEDTPAFGWWPGENGHAPYTEGLLIGHRHYDANDIAPRFPFGHGLSYTSFSFGALTVAAEGGGPVRASIEVTNDGHRPGSTVVQLYVADLEASVDRPPKELKAFRKVRLAPGHSETVEFVLGLRQLSYWDPARRQWRAEPGEFELLAGVSATDIRARARFVLHG
ncbi:MAG TPA: glycoside hydrolase family 3 C-terminal domain-containing protein [Acidimicrobiales bacterium]|nr:glycoside hydrolase family 3 C-terminal domain-containing protein [Acidimicrobiales bacterium]